MLVVNMIIMMIVILKIHFHWFLKLVNKVGTTVLSFISLTKHYIDTVQGRVCGPVVSKSLKIELILCRLYCSQSCVLLEFINALHS